MKKTVINMDELEKGISIKEDILYSENNNEEVYKKLYEKIEEFDIIAKNIDFTKSVFLKCNCQNSKFYQCSFTDTLFEDCDFSNVDFGQASFLRVSFKNCKMIGSKFPDTIIYEVKL